MEAVNLLGSAMRVGYESAITGTRPAKRPFGVVYVSVGSGARIGVGVFVDTTGRPRVNQWPRYLASTRLCGPSVRRQVLPVTQRFLNTLSRLGAA